MVSQLQIELAGSSRLKCTSDRYSGVQLVGKKKLNAAHFIFMECRTSSLNSFTYCLMQMMTCHIKQDTVALFCFNSQMGHVTRLHELGVQKTQCLRTQKTQTHQSRKVRPLQSWKKLIMLYDIFVRPCVCLPFVIENVSCCLRIGFLT